MYFYSSLLLMGVSFATLLFCYFKAQTVENKMFFQSSVVSALYLLLVVVSQVGLLVYPETERAALAGVGSALIVYGGIGALAVTFVMGVAGGVSSYQNKKTPLMVTSIIALLVFPFALPLFLFPFLFVYLVLKKSIRYVVAAEDRKKGKAMKQKMAKMKQGRHSTPKRKK